MKTFWVYILTNAAREWVWQYVFCDSRLLDCRSRRDRGHHVQEKNLQNAVKAAIRGADPKAASCHTFRHSFATHLLENGQDIVILGARAARSQRRFHHHDLYPRAKPARPERPQPARRPSRSCRISE